MKRTAFVLLIIFVFSQLAFAQKPTQNSGSVSNGKADETAAGDYVILKYDAENYDWLFKNAQSANLNKSEIEQIKSSIEKAVGKYNKKQSKNFKINLTGYKFQFVPVVNDKGAKEVWVNGFCDNFGSDDWRKHVMIVEDGGKCFFNLKVSLPAGKFYAFQVNGYA